MNVRQRALILGALLFVGLALRAARLDFQPLWWDEGYSVWFATHPTPQLIALTAEDIHPPLYYLLLRAWILLLGPRAETLRLLSVAVGSLAIPAIYAAGRRIFDDRSALLAALLLAINPLHVYYSQEVRMYGLVALLSAATLAAAWPALQSERPGVRRLAPYVLVVTAALYTQYYAALLPLGVMIYAAVRWRRSPQTVVRWLLAHAAVALAYLPWVIYATPRLVPYISQKVVQDADRPLDLFTYLARHLSAFVAGHWAGSSSTLLWPLLLLILPAAYLFRRRRSGAGFLLALTGTALLAGFAISLGYPFFPEHGERLLLLALPPFLLLLAGTIAGPGSGRLPGVVMAIGLLAAGVAGLYPFYTVPRYPGEDYRPLIARTVEYGSPPGYGVRRLPLASRLLAELRFARRTGCRSRFVYYMGTRARGRARRRAGQGEGLVSGASVARRTTGRRDRGAPAGERVRPVLNQWYGPGTRLSGWAKTAPPAVERRLQVTFRGAAGGGDILLASASAGNGPFPAANAPIPLTLSWEGKGPAEAGASLRLVGKDGQIWAQHDYAPLGNGLAGGSGRDEVALLVPAGTPPGSYRVEAVVVDASGAQTRTVLGPGGERLPEAVTIAELQVSPAPEPLSPERLAIGKRLSVELGDGIRFLGYSLPEEALSPGSEYRVNLFWQSTARPQHDYIAFVQLQNAAPLPFLAGSGQTVPLWQAPPGVEYGTTGWQAGTLMRTQATVRIPGGLADGRYGVIAGLFRPEDGARLSAGGRDYMALGEVEVRGRPRQLEAGRPQLEQTATFGAVARLRGFDLQETAVRPGGTVAVTLYWEALGASAQPLSVFVHLLGEDGRVYGQADGEPGGGQYPTPGWAAGEQFRDPHVVAVDPAAPVGRYRLGIGLYDPKTGRREPVDGGDMAVLAADLELKVKQGM